MKENDKTTLHLQEGSGLNYFSALHKEFGGEKSKHAYHVDNASVRIRIHRYVSEPGLELMVSEAWFEKDLVLERKPDEDLDFVHINMVLEGLANQSFKDKEATLEAGTLMGAFAYNGLFPMQIIHPAKQGFRSISIKIRQDTIEALLPEFLEMYRDLFSDPDGVAYHAMIPAELEKLCQEMFQFRDAEYGSRAMVIARGIEALTMVFNTIRKMRKKRELNGLHADDFERLQRIKEHILRHVDEKVSLEELASRFGISISKLKRDFKSLFDSSVYQFYTHARMDEAYHRLKTGKYSVMEVGYDLGYSNLSKFSEMFKKVKGISPSEVI